MWYPIYLYTTFIIPCQTAYAARRSLAPALEAPDQLFRRRVQRSFLYHPLPKWYQSQQNLGFREREVSPEMRRPMQDRTAGTWHTRAESFRGCKMQI